MIRGERVTVLAPSISYDAGMNEAAVWTATDVGNVLFGRPSTERIIETARYYDAEAAYTLGFPKGFSGVLRGCKIVRARDGSVWDALGDPRPLPPELCPTDWNMEVDVAASAHPAPVPATTTTTTTTTGEGDG